MRATYRAFYVMSDNPTGPRNDAVAAFLTEIGKDRLIAVVPWSESYLLVFYWEAAT